MRTTTIWFHRSVRVLVYSGFLFALSGCAHLWLSPRNHAELYIRGLDADGLTDVGAKIYMGDSGQVLTTQLTPTAVRLNRAGGWHPGQVIYLVLDAPGYRAGIHLVKLTRWAATPEEASLNANNADVILVKDVASE